MVVANHWALARDPVFGEDPDEFVPERWLVGDGDSKLKDLPAFAFGFGWRICPGRHIARSSLWLQMARLLRAFDIKQEATGDESEEDRARSTAAIDPLASTNGIVSQPLPFRATFKPRGPWSRKVIQRVWNTRNVEAETLLDAIGTERGKRT